MDIVFNNQFAYSETSAAGVFLRLGTKNQGVQVLDPFDAEFQILFQDQKRLQTGYQLVVTQAEVLGKEQKRLFSLQGDLEALAGPVSKQVQSKLEMKLRDLLWELHQQLVLVVFAGPAEDFFVLAKSVIGLEERVVHGELVVLLPHEVPIERRTLNFQVLLA